MLIRAGQILTVLLAGLLSSAGLIADEFALDSVTTLIENYCLECHDSGEAAGGLKLDELDVSIAKQDKPWNTETWEKMVKRLRARQMPPARAERPSEVEYQQALAAMESALDDLATRHPQPGRTDPVRRLNRAEYRNAIRDLLAIDISVEDLLPADQSGHGFDNVTVGELPPVLLSRYITAAEKIARLAVGRHERSPGGVTVRLPADRSQDAHVEGLPLGTRGGTLFRHQFPATGEYEIQLRLMRDRDENIEGLSGTHDIDVLLDRAPVHRFRVAPPKGKSGYQRDDTLVDAHLKKRFRVEAGPHDVGVTFPRRFASLSEIKRQPFDTSFNRHRHPRREPAIFEVSIVGPFDPEGPGVTPSRHRIFTRRPRGNEDTTDCASEILSRLMRLAYRRPVTDEDMVVPMRFFQRAMAADGFDAGIEAALTTVLINPHFLFRAESTPSSPRPGSSHRISDLELASRLSFFIWSSIPDEELLDLAVEVKLHRPDVIEQQVQRMLRDERSESLATNFAAQWLYLRNLDNFRPDMRLFPDFDDNLRQAMRRETELLFESVLREDRSVLDLISSDKSYLNERLAKHYGIPGVYGSHFRPVDVSDANLHRGGLLRHSSILSVTSYATRTAPTVRGAWILENILGTPPPPPPPNVPSLKEKKTSVGLTIRERLAEHRANPACASCHDLIDPVGFALENFDAVGRWRYFDDGIPIDSTGALPDGKRVRNLDELEEGILARPQMFVGTLTEKLLVFALGRGVEYYDGPAVRKIVQAAEEDDFRFSSLIIGIATSDPFQMRIAE